MSLFLDPLVVDKSNLLMTEQSYIDPCNAHHDSFGDIHTGYWFRNAHQYLCKNDNDLLCPLIFFIAGDDKDLNLLFLYMKYSIRRQEIQVNYGES